MTNDRCFNCKWYLGDLACMAFDRIPNEILQGENDHGQPLKGQGNAIVFAQKVFPKVQRGDSRNKTLKGSCSR